MVTNLVTLMDRGEQDCEELPNNLTQDDVTRIISQLLLCVLINTRNKLIYYDIKPGNFLLVRNDKNQLDFKLCDLDQWMSLDDDPKEWVYEFGGEFVIFNEFRKFVYSFTMPFCSFFTELDTFKNNLRQEIEEFNAIHDYPDLSCLLENKEDSLNNLNNSKWCADVTNTVCGFSSVRQLSEAISNKLNPPIESLNDRTHHNGYARFFPDGETYTDSSSAQSISETNSDKFRLT